jgi:hypothetical protein
MNDTGSVATGGASIGCAEIARTPQISAKA